MRLLGFSSSACDCQCQAERPSVVVTVVINCSPTRRNLIFLRRHSLYRSVLARRQAFEKSMSANRLEPPPSPSPSPSPLLSLSSRHRCATLSLRVMFGCLVVERVLVMRKDLKNPPSHYLFFFFFCCLVSQLLICQ